MCVLLVCPDLYAAPLGGYFGEAPPETVGRNGAYVTADVPITHYKICLNSLHCTELYGGVRNTFEVKAESGWLDELMCLEKHSGSLSATGAKAGEDGICLLG